MFQHFATISFCKRRLAFWAECDQQHVKLPPDFLCRLFRASKECSLFVLEQHSADFIFLIKFLNKKF